MRGAWADPASRPLSASQQAFCVIDGKPYGIPLLVNGLKRLGVRGTFFVEVLSSLCLGRQDTRVITDYLLAEGQDVQLHLHPNFWFYTEYRRAVDAGTPWEGCDHRDRMSRLPDCMQRELIDRAIEIFRSLTGRPPDAFRAGGYAAGLATLRLLRHAGVKLDSSYSPAFHRLGSFPGGAPAPNLVQCLEGVWELPVTVARPMVPESRLHSGFKIADLSALSNWEMEQVLDQAHSGGMEHVVLILHSFSMVKRHPHSHDRIRPNRIVIRRLGRFLDFLSGNRSRFAVTTFGALASAPEALDRPQRAVVPQLGLLHPVMRKTVQGVNAVYWL